MDNIVFEKVWQNDNLIELKISASSEFVSAYQNCYVEQKVLEDTSDKICDYIYDHSKPRYVELGKKSGNFTPAFSMCILPAEKSGHMKIEVDIEIADNDMRIHRCCFYVKSELGLVEQFGVRLKNLAAKPVGIKVALY